MAKGKCYKQLIKPSDLIGKVEWFIAGKLYHLGNWCINKHWKIKERYER